MVDAKSVRAPTYEPGPDVLHARARLVELEGKVQRLLHIGSGMEHPLIDAEDRALLRWAFARALEAVE